MEEELHGSQLMFNQPTVLQGASLAGIVEKLLENAAPGTLVVSCLDRRSFAERLKADLNAKSNRPERLNDQKETTSEDPGKPLQNHEEDGHHLLERTLENLSTSANIKIAFCTSIHTLNAYLSYVSLFSNEPQDTADEPRPAKSKRRFLVIVNAVSLHHGTPCYSAQGLGRALAAAVEAAFKTGARLLAIECPSKVLSETPLDDETRSASREGNAEGLAEGMLVSARGVRDDPHVRMGSALDTHNATGSTGDDPLAIVQGEMHGLVQGQGRHRVPWSDSELWNEQIPIVNATTKSFGFGSSAEWADRRVKVQDIVSRWFNFKEAWPTS